MKYEAMFQGVEVWYDDKGAEHNFKGIDVHQISLPLIISKSHLQTLLILQRVGLGS
jgi:hypothetical protein